MWPARAQTEGGGPGQVAKALPQASTPGPLSMGTQSGNGSCWCIHTSRCWATAAVVKEHVGLCVQAAAWSLSPRPHQSQRRFQDPTGDCCPSPSPAKPQGCHGGCGGRAGGCEGRRGPMCTSGNNPVLAPVLGSSPHLSCPALALAPTTLHSDAGWACGDRRQRADRVCRSGLSCRGRS